jgi:TRAP-type mannitol/chloroaromatic compound transport system permease large subunit
LEIALIIAFAVALIFSSYNSKGANSNAIWFLIITSFYLTFSILNSLGSLTDLALLGSRIYGILLMPNVLIIVMFIFASVILEKSKELDKINLCEGDIHPFSKIFYFTVLGAFIAGPAGTVGSCMILLTSFGKTLLKDSHIPQKLVIGLVLVIATMGQLVPPAVLPIMINDVMTTTVQNYWFSHGIYEFDIAPSIDLMNALYVPSLIMLVLILLYVVSKVSAPGFKKFGADFVTLFKSNLFFISGIIALSTISILNLINVYEFGYMFIALGLWITFRNRNLNKTFVKEVVKRTVSLSGGILTFLVIGNLIAFVFQINGNYDTIINYFQFNDVDLFDTHAIYIGHLLFLGMFLDPFEITYVFLPFTTNIMLMQNLDAVYVGALTTLVMQVAYLTPPIGFGLFYLKLLFNEIKFKDIVSAAIPFALIQIVGIGFYILYALVMSN